MTKNIDRRDVPKPLTHLTPAERHARRVERRLNTCIHHNGFINKICDAGVEYASVGETFNLGDMGRPFVAACFAVNEWGGQELECRFTCDKRQLPTREEVEKEVAETDARVAEHLNQIANNICPTHKIAITKKQAGSCVYAVPCGCRLYQGRLPK